MKIFCLMLDHLFDRPSATLFSKLPKKYILKKRFFTLIEIIIVITILVLVTGVIGVNVYHSVREQRFKTEVDIVRDTLVLAQNLMLLMDADTHVVFKTGEDEQSIEMLLKIDGQLDDRLLKLVTQKPKILTYIQFVEFVDKNKTHNEPGLVDVKFLSKGSVMSKGLMRLSTHETSEATKGMERFICLAGYPKPIFSTSKDKDDPACQESQEDILSRLAQFTVNEIHEKENIQKTTPIAP